MRIVEQAQQEAKDAGRVFAASWTQFRRYSEFELQNASRLRLKVSAVFEPPGEMCGTKYDETGTCDHCGSGARQVGPLMLDLKRIPKGKTFARTIAGELVVTQRVVELFRENSVTGVRFYPVRPKSPKNLQPTDWYQLVVLSADAEIVPPTRVGINFFDDDVLGQFRCPKGHVLGLNLLSEVFVISSTVGAADIIESRQFVGLRRGVLRPQRVLLISQKVRELIAANALTGCDLEVAHLV
jgi:hypothetical protein